MISSVIYFILAAFGLGLIVFIHEFGHYWMARKEGMKVEVFSIGFGSPICDWQYQGVKWQLCWLPFWGIRTNCRDGKRRSFRALSNS